MAKSVETVKGELLEDAELHFDPMPDFTEHDFRNTKRPLLWVVSHASEGAYMVQRYSDMVVEAARQYGINNYRSHYTSFMKVWRKEHAARTDNITAFENQPLELFCGAFEATDDGIYCFSAYGDKVCACPHPIMPVRRLVDIDSGEVRIEVSFKRGNTWRAVTVDKSVLASAAKIVALAGYGIGVDSENARFLVKYFTEVEHLNYDMIPETASVSRLGWIDDGSFSPYVEGVEFDGDSKFGEAYASLKPCGDYDVWRNVVDGGRRFNVVTRLYIAAAFASVLIKPLGGLPFFVHLWGGTEAGKSVALKAAISIFANPAETGGYWLSWGATGVGLEEATAFRNSLPLCLDELQIKNDNKRGFDEAIYMLSEGVGKLRGAKNGGIQRMRTWRNAILSTGESPMTAHNSGGGAVNRVIEIDCKDIKLFENAPETAGYIHQHYGHAGRVFIEMLSKEHNIALAKTIQKEYFDQLSKCDVTQKQALSASLVLTADKLADMWIFYNEDSLTAEDIIPYLSTKTEVDVNRRALDWLYGWIAENSNAFMRHGDVYVDCGPKGAVYGRIKDKGIAIIKTVFERAMSDAGYSPAAFLSWAKRNDVLVATNGKHLSATVRIGETPTRCVVIQPLADDGPKFDGVDLAENGLPM